MPTTAAARRYLLGAVAAPLAVAALAVAVLAGPWTPLALDAANARYTAGDVAGAEAAYADLVEGWRTPHTRAEAATRAGLLALARGDTTAAAARLRRAVELEPDAARRAEVRAQLAAIYRDQLGDPVRAAEEYERAATEAERAGPAIHAARCWELAGQLDRALGAWTRAITLRADARERALADVGFARAEAAFDAVVDAAQ